MYEAQANSPGTTLTVTITSSDTSISLQNASILPDAPNLLTIGYNTNSPETVLMTAKDGDTITVERNVEGSNKAWNAGVSIARVFTAKDYNDMLTALESLQTEVSGFASSIDSEASTRASKDIELEDLINTVSNLDQLTIGNHLNDTSNPHSVGKTDVGLGNVDNTADMNKPVSNNQLTALNAKQATLVSGTNIKTINNQSILGVGNLEILADNTQSLSLEEYNALTEYDSTRLYFIVDEDNMVMSIYKGERSEPAVEESEEPITEEALLDNGTDLANWVVDDGSTNAGTYIRLVQDGVNDFAKCPTNLVGGSTYDIEYEVIADDGNWKKLNLWNNLTGDYIEIDGTVGTHVERITAQLDIADNFLWFTLFSADPGVYIDILPISITEVREDSEEVAVGVYASDYGLVPNDAAEAVNNANKIVACINTNGSIIIDSDTYYIATPTTSLTTDDITLQGYDGGKLVCNKSSRQTLFDSEEVADGIIKNLEIQNLGSAQFQLFSNSGSVSNETINSIRFEGNTFDGDIGIYEHYGDTSYNPSNGNGITSFRFTENIVKNTVYTIVDIRNTPFGTVEIDNNIFTNVMGTVFNLAISNNETYSTAIRNARTTLNMHDNTTINDDDYFDTNTDGYLAMIVAEAVTASFTDNHTEGLHTDNLLATYDAYLSCDFVTYTGNTWKNNICFNSSKVHNTLIKAKTGYNTPTRVYDNNTFIVEKTYAAQVGRSSSYLFVDLINVLTDLYSFDITNNTFDVYDLRFPSTSLQIQHYKLNGNTFNVEKTTGILALIRLEDVGQPSIEVKDNVINCDSIVDAKFRCLQVADARSSATYNVDTIVFTGNTIDAPFQYIMYEPTVDTITISDNDITVYSSNWSKFAVSTTHPEIENLSVTVV